LINLLYKGRDEFGGDCLKDSRMLYLNMFIGEVGNVLILFCAVKAIWNESDITEFYILFLGLMLSATYTNYLEKLAGLSKKFFRIKLIVLTISLLIIGYIYFS
jgi:hypothetical protein